MSASEADSPASLSFLNKPGMIATMDLLREEGFAEDGASLKWNFGNGSVSAVDVLDPTRGYVVFVCGSILDARSMQFVELSIPAWFKRRELGIAWLAYACRHLRPARHTPWLQEGLALKDLLPWEAKLRAYEARPQCEVDREWFRLIARLLRDAAATAGPDDGLEFQFDGANFHVTFGGKTYSWPATGGNWTGPAVVELSAMSRLPKRLMRSSISFSVRHEGFEIDRTLFRLLSDPASSGLPPLPEREWA